jgi:TonB family protein
LRSNPEPMMKRNTCLLLLVIFLSSTLHAQETLPVKYYFSLYDEKPTDKNTAPYIVAVFKNSSDDNLWQREMYYNKKARPLASKGHSKDSGGLVKQGDFTYLYESGKNWKTGKYADNKLEGEWKEWDENGTVTGKRNYTNGRMTGLNLKWLKDGTVSDSIVLDDKGTGRAKGFFNSGNTNYEGSYTGGSKEGEWIYYYPEPSNQKCMIAQYLKDSAVSFACFNEKGEIQQNDCVFEREAKFPGDANEWKQYLTNALGKIKTEKYLPQGGMYRIMVRFIVDKTGTITDARIEEPGNIEKLNEAALKIITNSRKWIPAVQYNRKVNAYRRQPLTFAVD